jgi:hypothetical protein
VPVPIEVAPPVFARALSSGGAFRPRRGAHGSEATRALRGEGTRVRAAKAPVLFVVGCRLLFALGFFGACNPRHSDFHQYRFVLFRCSLRQTAAFCRIFAEAASVTVHDTFHLCVFEVCVFDVPTCQPGTLRTVPVQIQPPRWNQVSHPAFQPRTHLGGGLRASDVMAKPEDCRRYAAECLRLAQELRGRAEAAILLEMAERWRRLAKEAESRGGVSKDEE